MRSFPRVVAAALFAVLCTLLAVVPASAGTSGGSMNEVSSASSDLCFPFGCYTSNSTFVGFYHVPNSAPLCSASAVGAGTSSCGFSRSYSITAGVSASVDITLIKDSLSTNYGVNGSFTKTITITNGCSATFGSRGGYLYGVPEYTKYEFLVRNRAVGGGGANDAVVGKGWIGVPSGMKCFYKHY
ncbi:hypothetical protein [Lentzea sp. HUAS12]|uniref:hypothetical protein n=1 Tax=Lentzea sp. HUAS12 TaxID=2951806 RepID=UPI00209EF885|nr:hypothetical protein [Lentzea sp. HUAS12]USX56373.1 hypothetical protein ND450_20400 [Lentzea sp. HUAS12]